MLIELKRLVKSITPKCILELREAIFRRKQSKRSAADVFSEVYQTGAWGSEGRFFSGYGSHTKAAIDTYIETIRTFTRLNPGLSAVDIGCGDFNIGKNVHHLFPRYTACDVVVDLIAHNRKQFSGLDVEFVYLDIVTSTPPEGDVALIRQVFQHLSNAQIKQALRNLARFKFLIVTEHIPGAAFVANADKPQGAGIRAHLASPSAVVLTEEPFSITPIAFEVLSRVPDGENFLQTILYQLRR